MDRRVMTEQDDAMCEALTVDLERHVSAYRDEIVAKDDAAELEQMRTAETRLVAKMEEAIDKELDADEPEKNAATRSVSRTSKPN